MFGLTPTVRELTEFPACCGGTSEASVLRMGSDAFVAYDLPRNQGDKVALVRCGGCMEAYTNGPNDEARSRHPCYKFGLGYGTVLEVLKSPWIPELSARHDMFGKRDRFKDRRHFIFSLKEDTIDVAARDIALVGIYDSHADAMAAAVLVVSQES